MPTVLSRLRSSARSQLGLGRALWWALRRREDVCPADVPLPYNGLDRAALWTIMGGTNVELRFAPDAGVEIDGEERAVSQVSFLAEDPRAATTLIRAHVRSS